MYEICNVVLNFAEYSSFVVENATSPFVLTCVTSSFWKGHNIGNCIFYCTENILICKL